jgi:hypothetical protein
MNKSRFAHLRKGQQHLKFESQHYNAKINRTSTDVQNSLRLSIASCCGGFILQVSAVPSNSTTSSCYPNDEPPKAIDKNILSNTEEWRNVLIVAVVTLHQLRSNGKLILRTRAGPSKYLFQLASSTPHCH